MAAVSVKSESSAFKGIVHQKNLRKLVFILFGARGSIDTIKLSYYGKNNVKRLIKCMFL